jgi:hypothetical protein
VTTDQAGSDESPPKTLLQTFLNLNGIPAARMAREAKASPRQVTRWRQKPRPNIGLEQMIRLLRAARRITGKPVPMEELFDLEPENWPE